MATDTRRLLVPYTTRWSAETSCDVPVVILWLLSAIIVGAMVSLNTLLGPRATNPVKREPFECGNAPTGPAWRRFSVRFYMTAILFICLTLKYPGRDLIQGTFWPSVAPCLHLHV